MYVRTKLEVSYGFYFEKIKGVGRTDGRTDGRGETFKIFNEAPYQEGA